MRAPLVLVCLALACDCIPGPIPPDAGPQTPPDGSVTPWDSSDPCGSAERRLVEVGCSPRQPDTGTWKEACQNARANGLTFGVACIRGLVDRYGAAACEVSCR